MRIFLLCLLFLAPAAAVAQTSESDRGFIQGILEDALSAPGREVRLEGFAGALSSRATIDQITVTDPDGVWFTARGVGLSWNRSALLRGRVEIEEISVEEIALPRLPLPSEGEMPAPEASGGGAFSLPELPVSVQIDEMRIDRAILGEPLFGEAAEMAFTGSAQLAGGAGETRLEVRRLDREGSFTVDAAFDNASRELALDLDLSEPENGIAANLLELPDRPSVALSVEGNDPISNFTADILLATAGEERLSGQVRLGSSEDGAASFAADLSGDIAPVFAPQFREFLGRDVALVASGQRRASGAMSLLLPLRTAHLKDRNFLYALRAQVASRRLMEANERLRALSDMDELTGLPNRRHLERVFKAVFETSLADDVELAVVMIDVDHFKRFNDEFGHDAGDAVLQAVAAEMRQRFRDGDVVCRYGGEEFTIIAPGSTAVTLAQRVEIVRQAISELKVSQNGKALGSMTMSFGIASWDESMSREGSALIHAADAALYRAKREGRNRVVLAEMRAIAAE